MFSRWIIKNKPHSRVHYRNMFFSSKQYSDCCYAIKSTYTFPNQIIKDVIVNPPRIWLSSSLRFCSLRSQAPIKMLRDVDQWVLSIAQQTRPNGLKNPDHAGIHDPPGCCKSIPRSSSQNMLYKSIINFNIPNAFIPHSVDEFQIHRNSECTRVGGVKVKL